MIILGLNAYHGDSSACLVIDGKLICAIEEERIRRIKHWAGLPTESIKWCIDYAGISIKDVDYIAISRNPFANFHRKIIKVLTNLPKRSFLKDRLKNVSSISDIKGKIANAFDISEKDIKAEVKFVEHHRAHIGSAFFVSPFNDAVCVTIDGFGDFRSSTVGFGTNNEIKICNSVYYPHSLGIFYTALTQYLGFWKYGDEYKVMGLSALGDPTLIKELRKIIFNKDNGLFQLDTSYFRHDSEGVEMTWLAGEPTIGKIFSDKLVELLGPPRQKDDEITEFHQQVAASVQAVYEDIFFHVLREAYRHYKFNNLVLAGGCIQNSLANGKIFEKTPFTEVYIPPAAHDAGTSIGAAYYVWNQLLKKPRNFVMEHAYWGPEYNNDAINYELQVIINELQKSVCEVKIIEDEELLCKTTAKAISEGKIVGWFQGRTEWGPRALGNRSIVVDPRRKEMKDILNERIKRRETFRPFAPSILNECVFDWFENSYPVPFMEKVYVIKPDKRNLIPAVTHVDGTGRLQTVSESINRRYYRLIKEFYKLTGVPIVLNTSFNENEPIVNTPKEAIDCFLRTKMDVLVIENHFIERKKCYEDFYNHSSPQ